MSHVGFAEAMQGVPIELTVVMPCLNEAATIGACIEQVKNTLVRHQISGEVIIVDNGSSDRSAEIAGSTGARVIVIEEPGYGNALMGGIGAARGKYVIIGDADGSYDFSELPILLEELRNGCDLVIGNRFLGGIQEGAMPALHRYLGNPLLTGIGRLFFKTPCHDFHCGLRGFSKDAYKKMELRTTGMEFASEMIVKASLLKLRTCEVPTTLSPDGRGRKPHLRSWHDGWRHLRFLLLYSPRWLFLYPGLGLLLLGALSVLWLLPGPQTVGRIVFDVHTLLYGVTAILTGFQAIVFAIFTKVFGVTEGLLPEDPKMMKAFTIFNLERGLLSGAIVLTVGLGIACYSLLAWNRAGFGPMNPTILVRLVAAAMLTITLGVEIIFASFFLSFLGMKRK